MSKYKLTFKLKQHTPLIHFQWYQKGATLRASEVKPKLDKFLIEIFKKEKTDYKNWLVGNGELDALDYKMKINEPSEIKYFIPLSLKLYSRNHPDREQNLIEFIRDKTGIDVKVIAPSPYFANSDKIKFRNDDNIDYGNTKVSELQFAIKNENLFEIHIQSFYPELLNKIDKIKSLFFSFQNFGARQSKGFGSFTVSDTQQLNNDFIKNIPASYGLEGVYFKKYQHLDDNIVFENINNFWKILKAGNSFRTYQKSDIFNYFYNMNPKIRWEKRAVKKKMKINYPLVFNKLRYNNSNSRVNRIVTETDEIDNHFYIRALLGLAENMEFGTFNNNDYVKIHISDTLEDDRNNKGIAINRFKSPITFKIIGDILYMFVYKIDDLLQTDENGKDRKFKFVLESKINNNEPFTAFLDELPVPKNFSVIDFLNSTKYNNSGNNSGLSIAKSFGFEKL